MLFSNPLSKPEIKVPIRVTVRIPIIILRGPIRDSDYFLPILPGFLPVPVRVPVSPPQAPPVAGPSLSCATTNSEACTGKKPRGAFARPYSTGTHTTIRPTFSTFFYLFSQYLPVHLDFVPTSPYLYLSFLHIFHFDSISLQFFLRCDPHDTLLSPFGPPLLSFTSSS